ncbi:MAG: hypothetical protein ACFFB3_03050 [Candidatus Hodarchaeota archaeon]
MFAKKAFQAAFDLTKSELRDRQLSKERVKRLLDQGIARGIEIVAVSQESNSQGEWLVITLQAPNPLSRYPKGQWLQLTVYGLGYDFSHKQWWDSFRFEGSLSSEARVVDPSVLSLWDLWDEAEADVRIGLKEPSFHGEFVVLACSAEMENDNEFLTKSRR